MANFENKKIDFSQINGGVKFENGDVVSAEAINAPIEASAYAQEVAEEAKRIAEESGGGGSVDLSNYVQKTDYATATTAGVVMANYANGVGVTDGHLFIYGAENVNIDARKTSRPITPTNLDYAVKVSVTTNGEVLSDDEKTSACEWLGAVKKATVAPQGYYIYGTDYQSTNTKVFNAFFTSLDYGYLAMYGPNNTLKTKTPVDALDCANKEFVEDNFVAKIGGSYSVPRVYGVSQSGVQSRYEVGYSNTAYNQQITLRDVGGALYVPDGAIGRDDYNFAAGQEAVNRKYVDNLVPTIYTDADENNTTKKLRIYTDTFGYLHIDTE